MSLRQRLIACLYPDGSKAHVSQEEADDLVESGNFNWRDKTSLVFLPNNPAPSNSGRRGSGNLACKVGAPIARAFYRDRNRSGWATAFVERVRELA